MFQSDNEIDRWIIKSVNKMKLNSENNEFEDIGKYYIDFFEYCNKYEKSKSYKYVDSANITQLGNNKWNGNIIKAIVMECNIKKMTFI